ncbi:hypothetical protein [Robertmurraya mangrovi]|uniref:hypothetical protein n=1 Tax=Robertmurraya mangrovi TaxID=3098077 RepID=UPI002ACC2FF3|nr:hypothetical protein [Bacillus sp. 31A1R]
MNQATIHAINEMVFMDKLNLFEKPDVILYHPGHFPELNDQLVAYYKSVGASLIMIPGVYNSFLNGIEYEFYAPLLIREGIEKEKLVSISADTLAKGVEGVVESAFSYINQTEYKNILLAGKSFFCRRFYLLSSIYANDEKVIDILPLEDNRDITPSKWINSEKGRARVLNEIGQYSKILTDKYPINK